MVDTERKRHYRSARVLISGPRVITPQFAGTTITLTGGQVELLRNITQYLHRRSTFVGAYYDQYYLTVNDDDWDEISAIIADLEEKLMGSDNILFGYNDRYAVEQWDTSNTAGPYACNLPGPPDGEMWRVFGISCYRNTNADTTARCVLVIPTKQINMDEIETPAINTPYRLDVDCILKHGDNLTVAYQGCTNGEVLITSAWGYKMKVP